jgi:phospholipid/cholesterol/gamma-HCH transport system ATP-binding protein
VTSLVVTYDVSESLRMADYAFFVAQGTIVAEGAAAQMIESEDRFVRQFVRAQPDGPVAFRYPAAPFAEELRLSVRT